MNTVGSEDHAVRRLVELLHLGQIAGRIEFADVCHAAAAERPHRFTVGGECGGVDVRA